MKLISGFFKVVWWIIKFVLMFACVLAFPVGWIILGLIIMDRKERENKERHERLVCAIEHARPEVPDGV